MRMAGVSGRAVQQRLRPASFALYMALSARSMTASTSSSPGRVQVAPMLTVGSIVSLLWKILRAATDRRNVSASRPAVASACPAG